MSSFKAYTIFIYLFSLYFAPACWIVSRLWCVDYCSNVCWEYHRSLCPPSISCSRLYLVAFKMSCGVLLTASYSQHHELCVAIHMLWALSALIGPWQHCRCFSPASTISALHTVRTRIKVAKTVLNHGSRLSLRCIFPRFNLHPSKCNNICFQQQQLICTC
jgi:hypothetical protein